MDPNTGYVSTWLWIPKSFVNLEGTKNALTFSFPDPYNASVARTICLWRETDNHLLVPRSFWKVKELPFRVVDLRPKSYTRTNIASKIKLDHRFDVKRGILFPTGDVVQQKSIDALLASIGGGLQLACGKGKTIVSLEYATRLQVPTLIVVPDTQLLEQWQNVIKEVLDVPGGVGLIQGDKFDWQKSIVMTTYHTLGARAESLPQEVLEWFGLVIWDEGHHIPALTFAPSAHAFPGTRLYLTATPERDDGMHIVVEYHIGDVLYKDLSQDLKPKMFFRWTGLQLDESDPSTNVRAGNGELHMSMISSHFGKWIARMTMILEDAKTAVDNGRKVLVLSNSEAEIINMAMLWETLYGDYDGDLFSDIPEPSIETIIEALETDGNVPADVVAAEAKRNMWARNIRLKGCKDPKPIELSDAEYTNVSVVLEALKARLPSYHYGEKAWEDTFVRIEAYQKDLDMHDLFGMLRLELDRRQKRFIKESLPKMKTCGVMVHKVPPAQRTAFIKKMPVVFAITKYGKEGLDSPDLDTVLVSSPFSSRNGLQQLMGRPTRTKEGKKTPTIVFYVDNIGPLIGMCKKLMKHLRDWSHEEGGPFDYEQIGQPGSGMGSWEQNRARIFGP